MTMLGVLLGFTLLSEANHNPDGTFISLVKATKARIGNLSFSPVQLGGDAVSPKSAFYSGARQGNNPFHVFAWADTQLQIGVESVVKIPAAVDASAPTELAVGAFLSADAVAGSSTVVWGAKYSAYTFSPSSNAVGEEVNSFNRSGSTSPNVWGLNIGMVGNAATDAGLVIETANSEPNGRPDYGIVIGGPKTTGVPTQPAGQTGILIDHISSGEAVRIMDDNRVALNKAGNTYIRYNSGSNRVQIVRNNVIVAQF